VKYLNNFENYNESFKSLMTSSALIFTLFSNQLQAQDSKRLQIEKAHLSEMDKSQTSKLIDSVTKKKFDLYKDGNFYTDKTLFSSGSGTSLSQAVDNAQKDMEEKMKFLGKKGNQKIYTFEQSHTYHAVIITEILDKRIKNSMYDRESGIYR
jgi:hypothetical protein